MLYHLMGLLDLKYKDYYHKDHLIYLILHYNYQIYHQIFFQFKNLLYPNKDIIYVELLEIIKLISHILIHIHGKIIKNQKIIKKIIKIFGFLMQKENKKDLLINNIHQDGILNLVFAESKLLILIKIHFNKKFNKILIEKFNFINKIHLIIFNFYKYIKLKKIIKVLKYLQVLLIKEIYQIILELKMN